MKKIIVVSKIFLFAIGHFQSNNATSISLFNRDKTEDYTYFKFDDMVEKEQEFKSNGEVMVKNPTGAVAFRAWDKPAIKVVANKHATSSGALQKITTNIDLSSEKAIIETHTEKSGLLSSSIKVFVDYMIMLPKTAHVTVDTGAGSIAINGMQGSISADAGAGSITMESVSGIIEAHSGAGTISITCDQTTRNTIKVSSGAGKINIEGSNGSTEVSSGAGTIAVRQVVLPSDAAIDLSTGAGSIVLTLPENASASLEISTAMGAVDSEFTIIEDPSTKRGWASKEIHGLIGTGGAYVELSTSIGSISVKKQ
jgi:hypothetical protein